MTNTYQKRISSIWLIVLILLGIAGLAAGTYFDLPIDQAIYSPDALWAKLLAAAAPVPVFWGLGAAGYLAVDLYGDGHNWITAWLFAFVLSLIGPVYMAQSFQEEIGLDWMICWVAGLLLSELPALLYGWLMRSATREDKKKCMWILLIVCLGSMACVQGLKHLWSRPRYIAMMENSELPFHPWYEFGRQTAQQFSTLYEINHDFFRSFPSGHTQSVTCLFVWALIPVFTRKGNVNVLMSIALVCTLVTAFSRLVLGFHFLSDVSAGFLITILLFAICCWCFRVTGKTEHPEHEKDEDEEDEEADADADADADETVEVQS